MASATAVSNNSLVFELSLMISAISSSRPLVLLISLPMRETLLGASLTSPTYAIMTMDRLIPAWATAMMALASPIPAIEWAKSKAG